MLSTGCPWSAIWSWPTWIFNHSTVLYSVAWDTFRWAQSVCLAFTHLNFSHFSFLSVLDQLLSIQESDLGVIKPNIFTNMTNIGRVSFTNNKIDGIDSLKLTADNRVRQFHFIGNHVLNLSHGRTINIKGKSVYIITEFRVLNHKWQNCPAV